jgi:hypothetical protein
VRNVVVDEFHQHQLAVACEEGAGVVAIVASVGVEGSVGLDQVVDDNWGLGEDSCGCLGGWDVGVVT